MPIGCGSGSTPRLTDIARRSGSRSPLAAAISSSVMSSGLRSSAIPSFSPDRKAGKPRDHSGYPPGYPWLPEGSLGFAARTGVARERGMLTAHRRRCEREVARRVASDRDAFLELVLRPVREGEPGVPGHWPEGYVRLDA